MGQHIYLERNNLIDVKINIHEVFEIFEKADVLVKLAIESVVSEDRKTSMKVITRVFPSFLY